MGSSGKLWGSPGTPQEQLRNERREFQENRVFQAWEASGGPRGTQNRWGGLAGAKEKSQANSRLSEGGRVLRFLGRPQGLQEVRCVAAKLSRLLSIGRDRFPQSWGSLEEPRRLGGASESPRDAPGAPGTPQEQPRNEQREFQEKQVFRPWEASGGLRGTQNRWGSLAGAKGKA